MRRHSSPASEARRRLAHVADPGENVFLDDLVGFPSPPDWGGTARAFFHPWAQTQKPLKVMLLCAGIDAPGHALAAMGVPYQAEAWDVDDTLRPGLRKLHRSSEGLHLGRMSGDILQPPLSRFGAAHFLVAGPPCPPWSSLGVRRSFDDPRAAVFRKVLDIIVDQVRRRRSSEDPTDAFFMFLLENVVGMLKRSKEDREAGRPCPMEQVVDILREQLPAWWDLTVLRSETSESGLPHKRERVYLRGVNRLALSLQQSIATIAPASLPHHGLSSLVRTDLPNTDKDKAGRGNKHMQNLAAYKIRHAADLQDPAKLGMIAVVDLSRDISLTWGDASRFDDRCVCLTASNTSLWIFSLGTAPADLLPDDLPGVDLPVDRWLHPCERALLQGFPADVRVAVRDATRVFGNAMSVPVVGLIMQPVLEKLMPKFVL